MGALWMLALCTARRESELRGLRWTDVAWSVARCASSAS